MKKVWFKGTLLLALATGILATAPQQIFAQTKASTTSTAASAGLKLPTGFSASIVAPNVGGARHITVTGNGDIM